jgi:hypothetical protein
MLLTAIGAWTAALIVIAAVLYFSNGGADFSLADIIGFGGVMIIGSGLLMLCWYLPVLLWWQRRKAPPRPLSLLIASGVLLNVPIFAALLVLMGRKMAASEAMLFMAIFLIIGAIFGGGFAWSRRSLTR